MVFRKPLVSVVIPVYNKAETVGKAIMSVVAQTYDNIEVIIVNDGSTDDSGKVALDMLHAIDGTPSIYRVDYLEQENKGVALARNKGVFESSTGDLIMCLDADDTIGSRYLELLVPALWDDRDMGVVYTALMRVDPRGNKEVSRWPSEFNAEAHFYERFNQVPTAALARRAVWYRLGGQRQRYAPNGAGAEDGDFWLRAGTYGFGIKYIPPKYGERSMFYYSVGTGLVSGDRNYREVDWRSWSPWTSRKELMPTASIAPARQWSHPARIYQEPIVSVIIAVGPKHVQYLVDSLDSLDAQTLKKWEAIIVFDIGRDEWEELARSGQLDYIEETWPWAKFTSTSANGKFARELVDTLDVVTGKAGLLENLPAGPPRGPGVARNVGIYAARAPLLTFLDADDYFMPTALEKMVSAYRQHEKIIFAEHYGIAHIKKEELNLVIGEVVSRNERSGLTVIKQGVEDYRCEKAAEQPYTDGRVPYVICNVSSLIPRKWALKLGGFPEDLPSWEDVLFWWRASWSGMCFHKIREPLLVYRYHTGFRREHGRAIAHDLLRELAIRKKDEKVMGCGCGQAPGAGTIIDSYGAIVQGEDVMATLRLSRGGSLAVDDADLVQVVFEPGDLGDKMRFGQHDFGGGNFIVYGRPQYGQKIFVHKQDLDSESKLAANQNRPAIYREIITEVEQEPDILPVPEEPEVIVEEPEELFAQEDVTEEVNEEDVFPPPVPGYPKRLTPVHSLDVGDLRNSGRYAQLLKDAGLETAWDVVQFAKQNEGGLQAIEGIGPKAAQRFEDAANALV